MTNNFKEFAGAMNRAYGDIRERITLAAQYIGEEFVKAGREQPGDPETAHSQGFYVDRTRNLRGSIGYFLFEDGRIVNQSDTVNDDENQRNIAPSIPDRGIYMAGFAGMEYASYVEAKGYNVITAQALAAMDSMEDFTKDLKRFIDG